MVTLSALGVDLQVAPALASAAQFRAAMAQTGDEAKKFASTVKGANVDVADSAKKVGEGGKGYEQLGTSAGKGADDVKRSGSAIEASTRSTASATDALGARGGAAFRQLSETGQSAFQRLWERVQNVISSLSSGLEHFLGTNIGKWASLSAEIALLTRGLGLLSIPVLGAGAAFGTLGSVVAAGAVLWFTYSAAAATARTSLYGVMQQAGLTNVGLRAVNATLQQLGFSGTATLGGVVVTILALVAAYKLLKLAIDAVGEGAKRTGQELDFGIRSQNLDNTRARTGVAATAAIDLPGSSTESVIKAAADYERLTQTALGTSLSFQAVAGSALAARVSFESMAGSAAKLYGEIKKGDAEGTAKQIKSLQELGIFSDQARDKIAALQEQGASSAQVWAVAATALGAYDFVLKEKQESWQGAKDSLSKAWEELKIEFGQPLADLLTPVLQGAASFMRSVMIPAAQETVQAIREIVTAVKEFPQDVANFVNFIRNGGVRLDNLQDPSTIGKVPGAFEVPKFPKVTPKGGGGDDKSKGGSGSAAPNYTTDASLVEKYREQIEFLAKAMGDGSVSAGEFAHRQFELQNQLAGQLGDPSRYAADIGAFRAAQQEKLNVLAQMKQQIEQGTASFSTIVSYGLEKASDGLGKFTKQIADAIPKLIGQLGDGLGSALADIATGAKTAAQAFGDFARSFLVDIIKMITKALVFYAIQKLIGFFSGRDTSSVTVGSSIAQVAGIKHSGGLIGESGPTRSLAFVPRFHAGGILGSDERLIVGKTEEGVFTPAQMRALAPVSQLGGGRGGDIVSVSVTVNENGGQAQQGSAGQNPIATELVKQLPNLVVGIIVDQQRQGGVLAGTRR